MIKLYKYVVDDVEVLEVLPEVVELCLEMGWKLCVT